MWFPRPVWLNVLEGLVCRLTGKVRTKTHLSGYRVNQDYQPFDLRCAVEPELCEARLPAAEGTELLSNLGAVGLSHKCDERRAVI